MFGVGGGPPSIAAALASETLLSSAYGKSSCAYTAVRALLTGARIQTPAATAPASSAKSAAEPTQPEREAPTVFSIRPSVLSPLFTAWEHARQAGQRQALLRASLRAQLDLAREIPGDNILEVAKATRKRVKRVREIVTQLKQFAGEANAVPARCPDLDHAVGFCALLERSAERSQPDAREFDRVQRGEVSPWEHYKRHFHEPYLNVPHLQPLEVIYSKPDPEKLAKQLRATSQDQPELSSSSSSTSPARSSSPAALPPGSGPHVDVAGVTHSAGKRKASRAQVDLVPGSGQITVNGQQLECYFRDPSVRQHALEPLLASDLAASYDLAVRVQGGGLAGQAGAVRTAVARALCVQQPDLAERLADMTRWDGRVVERKKPGRKKARRGFQWVKR